VHHRAAKVAPARERGYILLFALGLMAVVTTVVLGVSVSLRLDAQLLAREKEALQEGYVLQSAAAFTAMQLGIAYAVAGANPPLPEEVRRGWALWRMADAAPPPPATAPSARGQAPAATPLPVATYEATLGSHRFTAQLQDASGLPDANDLTALEWERLFAQLGAAPERARELAGLTMEFKNRVMDSRGTAGFSSMRELLDWNEIPRAMVRGGTTQVPMGLQDLLVTGTRNRKVRLDTTPVVLLRTLGNPTDDHLQRLAAMRRSGTPITAAQAQQWTDGTGLIPADTAGAPAAVRARLRLGGPRPMGAALVATLVQQGGRYSVVDSVTDVSAP
jgi:hypothetical protein